ncbi:MAG: sulfotransferase domain-containing protein [Oligoflexia bacterium]|nr:sulfotransferase domain-containing protein [Oligoflexia bacterium]
MSNFKTSSPAVTIVIATHHKVGTVLTQNIFQTFAQHTGITFYNCATSARPVSFDEPSIIFDWHSKFAGIDFSTLSNPRGIHIIRDPRLVVVSAAYYHQRSSEAWLHEPLNRFGGLTYQQKILSLHDDHQRFEFEMEENQITESAGSTVRDMLAWSNKSYAWCHDVKLEDLMTDTSMECYRQLFTHLHIQRDDLEFALSVAYNNSVFNPQYRNSHVRSRGVEDWSQYFDTNLRRKFISLFGDVVEDLGYSW